MKRKMHKTLSLLLAAAMAFGVAAMPVAAEEPGVSETPITGNLEDGTQDREESENKTPEPSAEPTPAPSAEPTPAPSAEPTASAEPVTQSLSDEELAERRKAEEARGKKAFTPPMRQREVSKALRAYGKMVSSADKGGVRIVED